MKINPCSKCGSMPEINNAGPEHTYAICMGEGCYISSGFEKTEEAAITAWNALNPIMIPISDSDPLLVFIQEVKEKQHQTNWGNCHPDCIACKAKAVLDAWDVKHKEGK